MVAVPILAGAVLRILLGLLVDRVGAKDAGIMAQLVVISGLALAWIFGLPNFEATLLVGLVLGFAGASFAVALPQAGSYQFGFLIFASLCFLAIVGLSLVKTRWRSTWGALAGARI
jgi:nitrate/nitrite transporter NarK